MFKTLIGLAATVATINLGITVNKAEAVSINYITLNSNESQVGEVVGGDNSLIPELWNYYRFFGNENKRITLIVRRINPALHPAIRVWEGLATDTSEFDDIFSNGNTLGSVRVSDQTIPVTGPGDDPLYRFSLLRAGDYTVGVTSSFLSKSSNEPYTYRIPEPITIIGSLTALGIGALLKRQYKRHQQPQTQN